MALPDACDEIAKHTRQVERVTARATVEASDWLQDSAINTVSFQFGQADRTHDVTTVVGAVTCVRQVMNQACHQSFGIVVVITTDTVAIIVMHDIPYHVRMLGICRICAIHEICRISKILGRSICVTRMLYHEHVHDKHDVL